MTCQTTKVVVDTLLLKQEKQIGLVKYRQQQGSGYVIIITFVILHHCYLWLSINPVKAIAVKILDFIWMGSSKS